MANKLIIQIATIAILLFSKTAAAIVTCKFDPTLNGLPYFTFSTTMHPPGPIRINPSTSAIGDTLWSNTYSFTLDGGQRFASINCSGSTTALYSGIGVPILNNNVYPTSISGIGIKVDFLNSNILIPSSTVSSGAYSVGPRMNITISFIRTGNITAGGVISGPILQLQLDQNTNGQLIYVVNMNPMVFNALVPTCSVSTPSITVPLNTINGGNFKKVGTVSASQNFQIGMSCSGGSSGTSTNAYITFTDANNLGNISTILTLPGGKGAATGLGLQILNKGTPIGYGPDSSDAGNTNQWQVANIAQGVSNYSIPLGVRYIQTGNTVTPGTVNGRATFTMSYQ